MPEDVSSSSIGCAHRGATALGFVTMTDDTMQRPDDFDDYPVFEYSKAG